MTNMTNQSSISNNNKNLLIPAIILSIGLIITGVFIGQGIQKFKNEDRTVTIKGLAEQIVKSDYVTWNIAFKQAGTNNFNELQTALTNDRQKILYFLKTNGFTEDEIEIMPLNIDDRLAAEYEQTTVFKRFIGNSSIVIKTNRVDLVEKTNTKIDNLVKNGIILSTTQPIYTLKGFNEVKSKLLSESIKHAKEQAKKFAMDSDATLGRLKRANQGIVRVLDNDGSTTYEDDTGKTITKKVRAVSTFHYFIN